MQTNIRTVIYNIEIPDQGNVSKELYYHTNHTDYTFQRNNTIHKYDNRIILITQQNQFTYQRTSNQELQTQLLNTIVAYFQNHINNLSSSSQPPDEDPEIGDA